MYDVLTLCSIQIIDEKGNPRELKDIIDDMFRAFRKCYDLNFSSYILDAISYILDSGFKMTDEQLLAFKAMNDEQTRLLFAKQAAEQAEESDAALDEFLGSFKIIGGDDT